MLDLHTCVVLDLSDESQRLVMSLPVRGRWTP